LIVGVVTEDGVPSIELEAGGERWQAIIDTGFNGELELPERLRSHSLVQAKSSAFRSNPCLVSQPASLCRQVSVVEPELRGGEMIHWGSGVQRPASKSASARRPAPSNRPAKTSAAIPRSHCSAINSSNHSFFWDNWCQCQLFSVSGESVSILFPGRRKMN
jgi:hypothetical protein